MDEKQVKRGPGPRVSTAIDGAQPFVPANPTTGAEAAQLWGMSQVDAQQTSIKVNRNVDGTRRFELLDEVPMLAWTLADTARQFGPGAYVIRPSGGIVKDRQFTVQVSQEFASRAGFARVEQLPAPSQAMGLRLAAGLADKGADQLGMVLEAVLRPIVERLDRMEGRSGGGFDPMQFLQLQESMRANGRREMIETLDLLGRIRGDKPLDDEGQTKDGGMWSGLGEGLGKALLTMIQPSAKMPQPGASPMPSNPTPTMQQIPEGWTEADLAMCGPLIEGLRGFSGRLVAGGMMSSAEDMADVLLGQIQDEAIPAVIRLDERAKASGGKALAVIDPRLVTDYWVRVMGLVAKGVQAEGGEA